MGVLTRREDWPERLLETVAAARNIPYKLGSHDCLRFTCQCIAVMTGVDYWPRFAGYATRRQALVTIAKIAPSLAEAVTLVLDCSPLPANMARRGDVVLYEDAAGEHLGICVGAEVAVLGEAGLAFVRIDHAGVRRAWRIG